MEAGPYTRAEANERLVKALLSNRGLPHLAEVAHDLMGNPVLVVDPTYRNIARAGFEVDDADESPFACLTREELAADDMIHEKGLRYIVESGIDEELARTRGPVRRHNDVYELETLTQAITLRGVVLGHAMAIARNRPFEERDAETFSLFADLVGQELQKGSLYWMREGQAGPYFLSRLLDDEQPNPIACARNMKLVGFSPLPSLFVVCLKRSGGALDARAAESVRGQLRPFFHHSVATLYQGELVVLVSRAAGPQLSEADEAALARAAAANDLLVGISNEFTEVTDAKAHLEQARSAVRYGSGYTKILEDTHVYRYCEYTYMEMLDICNGHVNLLNYCHPAIWALWEHDQEHGSELLETLFAFMQNSCNTARTAQLLSLHKNTLLYRLNRIKEITGNDLGSGEDLFLFHLSIRALLYLGIFETRTKPRTGADLHNPA